MKALDENERKQLKKRDMNKLNATSISLFIRKEQRGISVAVDGNREQLEHEMPYFCRTTRNLWLVTGMKHPQMGLLFVLFLSKTTRLTRGLGLVTKTQRGF